MEIYFIFTFVTCFDWISALLPEMGSMSHFSLSFLSLFQATQGVVFSYFWNHFLCWSQISYREWKSILYSHLWPVLIEFGPYYPKWSRCHILASLSLVSFKPHRKLSLLISKTTSCVDPSYHLENENLFYIHICDLFWLNLGLITRNGVDVSFWPLCPESLSSHTGSCL
jgi:hypothetical protein